MTDSSTLTFFFTVVVAFVVIRWFIVAENVEADPVEDAAEVDDAPETEATTTRPRKSSSSAHNAGTSSSSSSSASAASSSTDANRNPLVDPAIRRNLRPVNLTRRTVTQDMIDVVKAMAPDLAPEQIEYDLQRTGNIELTVERYLNTGTLPYPPNYNIRSATLSSNPSTLASSSSANSGLGSGSRSASSSKSQSQSQSQSLLDKYNLHDKLDTFDDSTLDPKNPYKTEKIKWSGNAEDRQNSLKKQREIMILRARKNLEKKERESKGKN